MNNLLLGFIGLQEIVVLIVTLFVVVLVPIFIITLIRSIRKSKNDNWRKWTVKEVEAQLNKYQESSESKKNIREYFPVKEGNKISLIQFNEIVDFSTANNFVFLTDVVGKDYVVDLNLSDLENKLPNYFIRVHKSTIVNCQSIREVKKLANGRYDLVMKCEKERIISCSKSYNDKIKKIIDF